MFPLRLLVGLACLLLPGPVGAAPEGVEEVDDCLRRNIPEKSSVQTVQLETTDRTGGTRTLEAKIFWKRAKNDLSNTLIEVEAPPSDRGSLYLWLEGEEHSETWVFLPELQRVRRIHPRSANGSLFGSDFSYEDVQHVQKISSDSSAKRLEDTVLDGRAVYVVRSDTSAVEGTAYDHIVYQIDKETCVPLEIEFFETATELRKRLQADPKSLSQAGDGWVAKSTKLLVEKVEIDPDLSDRIFTLSNLQRRAR